MQTLSSGGRTLWETLALALFAPGSTSTVTNKIRASAALLNEVLTFMPIVTLIVTLAIVGLLLWLVNNYIPMDGRIKKILNVVVLIAVILWLLHVFGIIGSLSGIRIGQ